MKTEIRNPQTGRPHSLGLLFLAMLLLAPLALRAKLSNEPRTGFWAPNGDVNTMDRGGDTLYVGGNFA